MSAVGHDAKGNEIKLPVATKSCTVTDAIGVDRQIVEGMAVPLDLLNAYKAEVGDTKEPDPAESEGYDKQPVEDLQAEADRRGLTVEGTGAGGNVLKKDLVDALAADDGGDS